MLFIEAKWLYNYQLSLEDIFSFSYKTKEVEILNREKQKEKREINYLSSQMRQELVRRTNQSILNLSKAKKKGCKIGKLRFKSQVNSIPLSQFGVTHRIESEKYIGIQGFGRKQLKVNGLDQIPEDAEVANAILISRNGNYYLKIICFVPKEERAKTGKLIGLDFGIKDNIVDSDGNTYNFQFPEPKLLKKAGRTLNKKKKGSKNRNKQKLLLNKQYEKLSNKKKDAKNKFVSKLVKENDLIVIQDESIAGWQSSKMKGWGRRIHHSIMGGIISDLKRKSETLVVDKYFPSTQFCPVCGSLNKHSLDQRVYSCSCGYLEDRDTHAARNILNEGLKQFGRESIKIMPVEKIQLSSQKQEACGLKSVGSSR
jgi:transposase